jgi:hypothetical protein
MGGAYRHTQIGYVIGAGLSAAAALTAYLALATFHWIPLVFLVLFLAMLVQFATLTTAVDGGVFECSFGPGLIRRRIALRDVRDVAVVRNPWYYGWGIRLTPHGWLWNVSGTRGVELRLTSGRRFRVGSDEPETLAAAIRRDLGAG